MHIQAKQRDAAQVTAPAVDKRIVTIYVTMSASDYTGTDFTTLTPTATPTPSSDEDSGSPQANRVQGALSSLPSVITSISGAESMTDSQLFVYSTPSSTSTSSPVPTKSTATSAAAATETSDPSSSSSGTDSSSSSSSSSDPAAKAGIALGVLGGIFVILAFVYFIIMRRKKQLKAERALAADDNEKLRRSTSGQTPRASTSPVRAPRVSLGPMTGLFNLNNGGQGDGQAARAAPNLSARPTTSTSSNASENPFSNKAQTHDDGPAPAPALQVSAVAMDSATPQAPLLAKDLPRPPPRSIAEVSPIDSEENMPLEQSSASRMSRDSLSVMERPLSERRQSVRQENVPAPLDLTISAVPLSPAGTEFSMAELEPDQSPCSSAGAASIAAAGGPSNTTVHRVQLDFKPTLDDELGLQAGQVVRLLHEYDDGWALCIRLDRSQQGVVPRTCLSARPVKPRLPQGGYRGPPVNPQAGQRSNGLPPGARTTGPPNGQRGPGPMMRPMGPVVRPGPRPQSPVGPSRQPAQDTQSRSIETHPSPSQENLPGQAY